MVAAEPDRIDDQSGLPLHLAASGEPLVRSPGPYLSGLSKRLFDVVIAGSLLAVLAIPLLAVAVAIRLTSPGPALFRQERYGRGGTVLRVLKFRTLYTAATDAAGTVQTLDGDARVTPLGRILRRSSIDELPQLINVLRGEMSLVGPRPHPIGMRAGGLLYEELVPYYHLRHAIRPGLTGWAQANGYRGPTLSADLATARIRHDLAYIEHASLGLDLKIMLRTFRAEFLTGSGT